MNLYKIIVICFTLVQSAFNLMAQDASESPSVVCSVSAGLEIAYADNECQSFHVVDFIGEFNDTAPIPLT